MAKLYLEITLKIEDRDRTNAAGVYNQYKAPFLETIKGAITKELLVRTEDVQVLHGFETAEDAQSSLSGGTVQQRRSSSFKALFKGQPGCKDLYGSLKILESDIVLCLDNMTFRRGSYF